MTADEQKARNRRVNETVALSASRLLWEEILEAALTNGALAYHARLAAEDLLHEARNGRRPWDLR